MTTMNKSRVLNSTPQQKLKLKQHSQQKFSPYPPTRLKPNQQTPSTKKPDLAVLLGSQKFYRRAVLEYLRILQNCLIRDGKKQRATRWVTKLTNSFIGLFNSNKKRAYKEMYKIFIRVTPSIYLRKFHVARSAKIYGLPLFKRKRKQAAAHLLIKAARSRNEKGFQQKLVAEFIDLYYKKPHTPSLELLRHLYETAENNRSNVRFLRFINSTK